VLANTYVRDNRLVKACSPTELSHFSAIGHEASDRIRAKLRMFRNIILIGTLVMTLILAGVVFWAYKLPDIIPLCFTHGPDPDTSFVVSCPTAEYLDQVAMKDQSKPPPNGGDVFTIAMMGVIGGVLSSALFIRGLSSNPTPYNVAIPLALLKIPFGAATALTGVLLLAGDFVPGFTAVDKQTQILAYAILFGFGQQFFTRYLDKRAEELIQDLPAKSKEESSKAASASSTARQMVTVE
jgi:hypothetical protein